MLEICLGIFPLSLPLPSHPIPSPLQKFSSARHPMVIVGSEMLQRNDSGALLSAAMTIAGSIPNAPPTEEWRVLNILQRVTRKSGPWYKLQFKLILRETTLFRDHTTSIKRLCVKCHDRDNATPTDILKLWLC